MHGILRAVAMLLLVTMAAMPGAQAMPFPAMQPGHLAGCHGHAPSPPVPSPTNYQCCVSGHHAAIPNAVFSIYSTAAQVCSLVDSDRDGLEFVSFGSSLLVAPSYSPPGAVPLRI